MPLTIWNCVLSYKQKNYFSKNLLVLPRNYFRNRIPKNFLLPTFLAGGKWDFQVANLLLATVNFEPWITQQPYILSDNSKGSNQTARMHT